MKTKRLLVAGLTLSIIMSAVSGLVACEHTHDLKSVAKKDATCTEAGYEAHYQCSECEKLFADGKGETEISEPKAIAAGHRIEAVGKKDATCAEAGAEAHYKCTACNKLFADAEGKTEIAAATVIPTTEHVIELVAKKRPTCTEEGYEEHFKCTKCNALFADEEGTTPIEKATAIPAEHRIGEVAKKEANCIEAGYEAHYQCELCKKLYSDEAGEHEIAEPVTIPISSEHTIGFGFTKDTAPAPVEAGGTLQSKCTVCGKSAETITYIKGFTTETVTASTSLKMETAGTYYVKNNKSACYFSFHVTKAGTYKLTFTEVFSQATLTRQFYGIHITENAYSTSAANNLWDIMSNTWTTKAKFQDTVNKYKNKIVREETVADYSSALGPCSTLNSITFTLGADDIPEGGLYITVQTASNIYDEEAKKVVNPTDPCTYLIKFEAPAEQA